MSIPKLKFKLDVELDKWTAKEFLTFDANDMFSNSILTDHPELKKVKELEAYAGKEFTDNYITGFYSQHKEELEQKTVSATKDWSDICDKFYSLVDKLFSQNGDTPHIWPEGNYACFLSIFNCNPRFIKEKFFQAFYNHPQTVNYVCMHEMLHFAFYDYVENNFTSEFTALGENGMWKLSEIFNDVILRQPDFIDITEQTDPPIYAQSREELNNYLLMWQQDPKTNHFLINYLKSIQIDDFPNNA